MIVEIWTDPIRRKKSYHRFPDGYTLAQIMAEVPVPHDDVRDYLDIHIGGAPIHKAFWKSVRPKPDTRVVIRPPLHGGRGGKGFSKILSSLAAIALVGASLFVGGGGLFGALGSSFSKGAFGAKALSGLLAVAANFALQGLGAVEPEEEETPKPIGFASVQNEFEPGANFQLVLGTFKVTPQVIIPGFTEIEGIDGSDQYAYLAVGIPGIHEVGTIYHGDIDIETVPQTEVEILQGFPDDPQLTLITDTRIERQDNIEMSEWKTDREDDNDDAVELEGTLEESEPQFHRLETENDPEFFRMEFVFTNGLVHRTDTNSNAGTVIFRFQMRIDEGDDWGEWVKLPQLLIRAKEPGRPVRCQFYVHWVDEYPANAGNAWPPVSKELEKIAGWGDVFSQYGWDADQFLTPTSSGYEQWEWENEKKVHLYLLTSEFPMGRYQFDVKRSYVFPWPGYDVATHTRNFGEFGITVDDWFVPIHPGAVDLVPANPQSFQHSVTITTRQSGYSEYPINTGGNPLTVIAVRVKNQSLNPIQAIMSRLIDDWNGSAWVPLQVTSNPAAIYRDTLKSVHNVRAVPDALINTQGLEEWHEWCTATDRVCNTVIKGKNVLETLRLIALTGWASPVYAPLHTVVIDQPRLDGPVGIIGRRNATRMFTEKIFSELPHALRVTYVDESSDYKAREVEVFADGYGHGSSVLTEATLFQSVTYDGITVESQAIERAERDLAWMYHRGTLYHATVDIEFLEHSRGKLVLWETDMFGRHTGTARIREIEYNSSGLVSSLIIDDYAELGEASEDLWSLVDLWSVADLWDFAGTKGIAIRLLDETVLTKEITSLTDDFRVVFTTPFAMPTVGAEDAISQDALVVTGPFTDLAIPVIIWDVQPGPDLTAEIIAIDYAENEVYFPNMPGGFTFVVHEGEIVFSGINVVVAEE